MRWVKLSRAIWMNERGNQIVKYSMAGKWVYLCYTDGYKDFGDYASKQTLNDAKAFFGDEKFKK